MRLAIMAFVDDVQVVYSESGSQDKERNVFQMSFLKGSSRHCQREKHVDNYNYRWSRSGNQIK